MLLPRFCGFCMRGLLLAALALSFASGSAGQVTSSPPPSPSPPPSATSQPNLPAASTGGQQEEPPANDDGSVFVFKKQVEEVVLHATVQDEQRHLVTDLDRTAFSVSEDGVPQTITSFRREDVPVAMGIVIDNSGSMREKRATVNQAVLDLIRASNPADEIFVVNFGTDFYLDQDFTSDTNLLRSALQRVSAQGTTALYDAVVASDLHLTRAARLSKKVLLVITDGQDNASQETLREAVSRLQQDKNGPALYAIGLHSDDPRHSEMAALDTLATGTGGIAFLPQSLDEVDTIARSIAHDVRSQYSIGYKSTNARASGYRRIQVDARARTYGRLTVLTRHGYYAGEAVH